MAKEKINFEDEQVRLCYRHTTSHILAQAVKKLWPDAKLAIGPAIDNGFYYDFDMEHKLNDQDLLKIQKEIKKVIQANYPLNASSCHGKKPSSSWLTSTRITRWS